VKRDLRDRPLLFWSLNFLTIVSGAALGVLAVWSLK
jgi:hypothetical protein